ncbi:GNAT family N-acetyltransferase [Stutzerimonas nosocomialis]|uniref:GNAT family N-acetyltransferase n=1 Tax=Stutzerimonas nosocomialis TaxID=1056496 RepID=A0A5R9QCA7_9GAMM|nr:GNAT family N-acetyltransferase [Stutzerimonas nosocomialis]TLX53614.1 GNAT family N-acetyltransferase [Stutzerimonas nosocomialis]TLX62764.1 GNAT family N-acetyltransferase [Stutzerimonas nosocomialis]
MPSPAIRPAGPDDCGLILELITDLARYEKAEHEVLASADDIHRSLFGDEPAANALICEIDGAAVGFAVYFVSYSTWLGKPGLYLEDLYVKPEHRGSGAGKALLRELAALAVAKGYGRFEWSVLDWNEPAIRFYQSIGAEPQAEWVRYRLDGEALQRFANGG